MDDNILKVLAFLAGGGGLGAITAFVFERFKWFQKLTPDAKFWTIGAISIGIPSVATALLLYVPPEVWAALQPFWLAVVGGGAFWLSSQFSHKRLKPE